MGRIFSDPSDVAQEEIVWPIESFKLLPELGLVVVISLCQLLTQAALGMSLAPLLILGRHFGIDHEPGQMSWSPAAYSLTVGTFILVAGRIGDLYGHRRAVLVGWFWFGICGLAAGFTVYAKNHGHIYFDVLRALQGIGPAILLPNGVALLGRFYPPGRRKDMAFSFFGLTAPLGFMLGATFSSLIGQLSWWPWIYWVHAIVCFIAAALSWITIPSTIDEDNPLRREKGALDVPGCLTGVSGLILINFAWNQGAVVGWETVYVYLMLLLGILAMSAFFWVEKKATYPLVPLKDLSREIILILVAVGAGWSSFGIWIYYLWQSWLVLRGDSPLKATAQFSPICLSGIIAALLAGYLMSRVQPGYILLGSMVAFGASNVIAAVTPPDLTYWAASFIGVLIAPFGMDCSFPAANLAASDFMSRDKQGVGASLVNTMINYSISIGLGIGSLVETHISHNRSLLDGYRGAHYVGIGLAGLGMLASLVLVRKVDRLS
ncbi:hypothetical protein FFLO_01612 [Filobasidium floriforme]|uniref:Major facilitator superfamily (MFS) profile domain-containing protein n=1 Tax=Filobasidium floriforme TaxID=5210 RepID=A0A8K0NUQ2_9TREE|nr:major facilitator superfamily [Filobasidium floriforme]KAG7562922.1 hypothetical protein FFLO_01612 [Filobasidium floriforme]KAH8080626.1 major facilitator superfamily [Filobasidium floriforme]